LHRSQLATRGPAASLIVIAGEYNRVINLWSAMTVAE
jgi:hypothetical protein